MRPARARPARLGLAATGRGQPRAAGQRRRPRDSTDGDRVRGGGVRGMRERAAADRSRSRGQHRLRMEEWRCGWRCRSRRAAPDADSVSRPDARRRRSRDRAAGPQARDGPGGRPRGRRRGADGADAVERALAGRHPSRDSRRQHAAHDRTAGGPGAGSAQAGAPDAHPVDVRERPVSVRGPEVGCFGLCAQVRRRP